MSVTCGAGGTTRDLTLAVVRRLARERQLEAVPHVTATGFTREGLIELLAEAKAGGADNVLALRGDPPRGEATWTAPPGGVQSRRWSSRGWRPRPASACSAPPTRSRIRTRVGGRRTSSTSRPSSTRASASSSPSCSSTTTTTGRSSNGCAPPASTSRSCRGSSRSRASARSSAWPRCATPACPTRCAASSRRARTTRRPSPSSAWPTRPRRPPSCWPTARRACTCTR